MVVVRFERVKYKRELPARKITSSPVISMEPEIMSLPLISMEVKKS